MILLKLALSNFRVHKIRFALTVAAIALSVSLVVSVTSGYASAQGAAEMFFDRFVGSIDSVLFKGSGDPMPEAIAEEMERDPDVAGIIERLETDLPLVAAGGTTPAQVAQITGIRR